MKNAINLGVLVLIVAFLSTPVLSGETKNEILFDCNRPSDDATMCLACNIYHEARSETAPGLWLVALATKNRVDGSLYPLTKAGPKVQHEGFKNEFCKVVYEQRRDRRSKRWVPMFSWTLDGKHDRVYNKEKWKHSIDVAERIIASHYDGNEINDITFGCQWYHHYSITPYWIKDYHPTVRIGAHQCYSLNEQVYLEHLDSLVPDIGM